MWTCVEGRLVGESVDEDKRYGDAWRVLVMLNQSIQDTTHKTHVNVSTYPPIFITSHSAILSSHVQCSRLTPSVACTQTQGLLGHVNRSRGGAGRALDQTPHQAVVEELVLLLLLAF